MKTLKRSLPNIPVKMHICRACGCCIFEGDKYGSFYFNGDNSYYDIVYQGNNTVIPINNSDYTISVWFKPSNLGGSQGLIGWGNYGFGNQVNAMKLDGTELVNYWWGDDLETDGAGIIVNVWYNGVCTYNSTTNTRTLYVNGNIYAIDNPSGEHSVPNADNLTVGATNNGSEPFTGNIANINIYNVALTSDEVYNNYFSIQPYASPII